MSSKSVVEFVVIEDIIDSQDEVLVKALSQERVCIEYLLKLRRGLSEIYEIDIDRSKLVVGILVSIPEVTEIGKEGIESIQSAAAQIFNPQTDLGFGNGITKSLPDRYKKNGPGKDQVTLKPEFERSEVGLVARGYLKFITHSAYNVDHFSTVKKVSVTVSETECGTCKRV